MKPVASPLRRARRALGALLAGLALAGAGGSIAPALADDAAHKASEFGRTLVLEADLPDDVVRRYATFRTNKPDAHESALVNAVTADAVEWGGSMMSALTSGNPYTLVVTVHGVARADGDVATMWQSGWKLEDGSERISPLPLARNEVKAGQRIDMTRASTPLSFKVDRSVLPVVNFVRASNVDIDRVHIQVWSGIGETGPREFLFAYRYALVGVVMLALAIFWLRR